MFDQPFSGPRHEFGQRQASPPVAGNWFCAATGHQRSLFKHTQTERLNDHADSSHSRCLVRLERLGWKGESLTAAERKGGMLWSPSLYVGSREKRCTGFIFKSDFNICSPTKPKPTEYRIYSPMAARCVFPATSDVFYHWPRCHLN